VEVPLPPEYSAIVSDIPVSKVKVGVPPEVSTYTTSLKTTWIEILSPTRYEPFGVEEVTEVTLAAYASLSP
jgi:hypothetical protein